MSQWSALRRFGVVTVACYAGMLAPTFAAAQQPLAQSSASAAEIREGEELTLERVVAIARERQPDILAARGSIDAGQGKVGQAKSRFLPQVDGNAALSRFSPAGSYANPNGNDASYGQISAGVTVNQMLYDFGKTATQVALQETNVQSSRADLVSVEERVVLNAKLAFFELLKQMKKRAVAADTVAQFEKHRVQAMGFFDAGVKPKYDVTKAEVDLSNAKLNLIRSENGVRLARVALNAAMGFSQAPGYEVKDSLDFTPFPVPLADAVEQAYARRPELKTLLLKKKAAEQAVLLAGKGDSPFLGGTAGASYGGEKFPLDEGWNVGLTLSVPVFNGNKTRYEVGEAEANLAVIAANENALRQAIYKEVQQGYLTLREAEERIQASRLIVRQAEENYGIASGRYEAGVGNPVEVADADVSLAGAKTNHVEALYDYKIAQAAIEKAIGAQAAAADAQSR